MAIFLVDFDGTCVAKVPGKGYSNYDTGAERVLKRLIASGHEIVLWTCRNNSSTNPYNYIHGGKIKREETSLEEAVRWFKERDIPLSGINESPDDYKVGEARKALGDFIIDDIAIGTPLREITIDWISYESGITYKNTKTSCVDWEKIEQYLESIMLI